MKRYLITLNIVQNGRKIEAIKDLRSATGMSLLESKNFVEKSLNAYIDSFGGDLIVNAEQLADLTALMVKQPSQYSGTTTFYGPTYNITRVKLVGGNSAVDISSLRQMEV